MKLVPQPNASVCQSASICMALGVYGDEAVYIVREALEKIGEPGDPAVMGEYLRSQVGDRYEFSGDASITEMMQWLTMGDRLITHGWFTNSGHVIAIDGFTTNPSGVKFKVLDPWSEFDFLDWRYNSDSIGFEGNYSALGIYAACVPSDSVSEAIGIYAAGDIDVDRKAAWVHRVKLATSEGLGEK